jgi:peroxiredoxin
VLTLLAGTLLLLSCAAPLDEEEIGFRPLDPPVVPGSMAPNLASDGGRVLLSWLEPGGGRGQTELRFVHLERRGHWKWSDPLTMVAGDDFFVNWADFPSVASAANGNLIAHWLVRSGEAAHAYDIVVARSSDGGSGWSRLGTLHNDGTETEHGFVSLVPEGVGVRAFWLDGRETLSAIHSEDSLGNEAREAHSAEERGETLGGPHSEPTHGDDAGNMTLRTTWIGEKIEASELLDSRVCDCCQTGAAMTADGPVVLYRDRSDDEIRDISIVRRTSDGWSAPATIHADGWKIAGCPVNGPAVASGGADGRLLAVAWYSAPDDQAEIKVIFSRDAGASFAPPVVVDHRSPLGRVDVVLDETGEAIVSWLASGPNQTAEIRLRRVSPGESGSAAMGEPLTVASGSASRASGFPRLVRHGRLLAVAWTDAGPPTQVRAGLLPTSDVPLVGGGRSPRAGAKPSRRWDGKPGSLAPAYTATTLSAEPVKFSQLRGKPVLLNFWATWCTPCRAEVPELAAMHERYGPAGLQVIGVSTDHAGADEQVREFIRKEKIPYEILRDPENRATGLFGLSGLPATFLLDGDGVLVWSYMGALQPGNVDLLEALERVTAPAGPVPPR